MYCHACTTTTYYVCACIHTVHVVLMMGVAKLLMCHADLYKDNSCVFLHIGTLTYLYVLGALMYYFFGGRGIEEIV